jgi:hypothetical protein
LAGGGQLGAGNTQLNRRGSAAERREAAKTQLVCFLNKLLCLYFEELINLKKTQKRVFEIYFSTDFLCGCI